MGQKIAAWFISILSTIAKQSQYHPPQHFTWINGESPGAGKTGVTQSHDRPNMMLPATANRFQPALSVIQAHKRTMRED
ncbi:hypothetical protein [Aminobacter sp. SS-2016]|uniref:hypothetical protein n=1 Tax=Aminobacter sp. Y103A TaxID=1870862 RepID=UPI0025723DB1|nr:hypothetical protein [Aminobacter sp. SS-2016]